VGVSTSELGEGCHDLRDGLFCEPAFSCVIAGPASDFNQGLHSALLNHPLRDAFEPTKKRQQIQENLNGVGALALRVLQAIDRG